MTDTVTTSVAVPTVTTTSTFSLLENTIKADLSAGVSWFETEAEDVGLYVWNTLKSAFIALEPAVAKLVMDVLGGVVADADQSKTIEQIETDAMNTATGEAKQALVTAGSGVVQTLIAGLKANQ